MTTIPYTVVDVFTPDRFAGNPLAVVTEADGLDAATMQAIAREFNFSETTFVLAPQDPENTARVRIFTPTEEVPFAGHPNVGTGFVLGAQSMLFGRPVGNVLRFEEAAGLVEVALSRDSGAVTGASIRAPQALQRHGEVPSETVAGCVGLPTEAVRTARHAPTIASVGLAFVVAEVVDADALGRALPDTAAFRKAQEETPLPDGPFCIYLYAVDAAAKNRVRARMFAPLSNIPEDPATGSAAGALGALLSDLRPQKDLSVTLEVLQGVEMGRPSRIEVETTKAGGSVTEVNIGGPCVRVMTGEIALDGVAD